MRTVVMKFGGTSVADADAIGRLIAIVNRAKDAGAAPVVVVSAMSGVTDRLIALAEAASEGFESLYWAFRYIQGREAWLTDGALIERYRPPLGPGVAERFAFCQAMPLDEFMAA